MNALLDLDQLRTFIAIAETGSFTKAAEQVNKTQSAVSMQMRRLEERVGQPIFVRDGRQSRVTDAGIRLLDYARRMLSLNAETIAAFSSDAMSGTVKLGLPDDYAPRLLPTVLASFATTHPNIEIEVVCEQSSCLHRRIQDGRLDLGIVTHGSRTQEKNGRIIRSEPLLWVSSAHHSVHCQATIPLALGTKTCSWRSSATEALSRIGKKYRIAYVSSSAAASSGRRDGRARHRRSARERPHAGHAGAGRTRGLPRIASLRHRANAVGQRAGSHPQCARGPYRQFPG